MANLVGREGTLTVGIRGSGQPGEVLVKLDHTSNTYIAYADRPIERNTRVVVFGDRGGLRVDVEPLGGK